MGKNKKARGITWGSLKNENIGFLVLLTALWASFHRHVLLDGQAVVLGDAARGFFPQWLADEKVWNSGLIPLWNPDEAFGNPNLANVSNASWYFPLRFFYHWFSPVTAFNAVILSHHLLALIGFFCFLKGRKLSGPSSFLGSVFFGFSIHVVTAPFAPALIMTLAWIPWLYWAGDRFFNEISGSFLTFSIFLALQLSAGFPILVYLTLFTLLIERIFDKALWKPQFLKTWIKLFSAMALSVGFNMVWIPSFIEFLGFGNTGQRLSMLESMPIETLLTWFNPFYLFHPLHGVGHLLYEFSAFFMGLPALGLVLWGAVYGKLDRKSHLLALLWMTLSIGGKPAQAVGIVIPFYNWVARSGYWMGLVIFAFAYLAALAVERWQKTLSGKGVLDWKWLVISFIVYGSALFCGVPTHLGSFWISFLLFAVSGLRIITRDTGSFVFLALATIFSVWPADEGVRFTMDRNYYETPPPLIQKMVEPGRIYASFPEVSRFEVVSGQTVAEGFNRLKNALVSNWPLAYGKEECYFYGSFFLADYFKWCFSSTQFSTAISRKVLNYLNVRYVLGSHHFENFKWINTGNEAEPLSENLTPMPKWFTVSQAIPESDFTKDLWKVGNPSFEFNRQCFVEKKEVLGFYSPRVVREIERTPNSLILQAEGRGKALLVSSEIAYPGWVAEVKCKKADLLEVNHGFRGIILEDREQTIKMVFRPSVFRFGCFLSLLVCGLWTGMILKKLNWFEECMNFE